jgi:group I intron endonuclease
MSCGIYHIINKENNKGYIGSSKVLEKRFKQHLGKLKRAKHPNRHLQGAWNTYGEDKFEFKKILNCPEEYQYKLELWFLTKSSLNSEYNINREMGKPPTTKRTDAEKENLRKFALIQMNKPEVKLKNSIFMTELWKTEEHRKKVKQTREKNNSYPRKITLELATAIKNDILNIKCQYKRSHICSKYNISIHIYKDIQRNKTWNHA